MKSLNRSTNFYFDGEFCSDGRMIWQKDSVTPEGDFESRCVDATPKGAWYTVEYRELTINGIPFHAVGKGFRIEEDLDE